jgi:hypothetical protein
MSLVLDASLTIAALLQERHTGAAQQVMREVSQSGAVVPSLWRLEVANVCACRFCVAGAMKPSSTALLSA